MSKILRKYGAYIAMGLGLVSFILMMACVPVNYNGHDLYKGNDIIFGTKFLKPVTTQLIAWILILLALIILLIAIIVGLAKINALIVYKPLLLLIAGIMLAVAGVLTAFIIPSIIATYANGMNFTGYGISVSYAFSAILALCGGTIGVLPFFLK